MKKLAEIKVIEKICKAEIKEKGSRFISFAIPIEKEEEVFLNLEKIKKEFYDASHHCYAFKFMNSFKYSDAGEPSGTAGIRIYNAIEFFNIVNTLLVVVRYFGGTKLGVGGLGRAYYKSAIEVLKKAEIKKKYLYQKVFIKIDFPLAQKVYQLINNTDNKILNVKYSETTNFDCLIKPGSINHISQELIDFSNGKVELKMLEMIYY